MLRRLHREPRRAAPAAANAQPPLRKRVTQRALRFSRSRRHLGDLLSMLAAVLAAVSLQPPPAALDRRAVLSSGGALAAALLAVPLPVSAKSKARAAAAALQKETAKEQAQAMKEYKYAPRPVIEGSLETGYKYDKSTLKSGSTGELADYYRQKGAKINAEYFEEQARAQGSRRPRRRRSAREGGAVRRR